MSSSTDCVGRELRGGNGNGALLTSPEPGRSLPRGGGAEEKRRARQGALGDKEAQNLRCQDQNAKRSWSNRGPSLFCPPEKFTVEIHRGRLGGVVGPWGAWEKTRNPNPNMEESH